MDGIVRIQEIEINNFKNIEKGVVSFQSYRCLNKDEKYKYADILGLYGQNGSGKTSLIEAIDILKTMLSGRELDKNILNLFKDNSQNTRFKYTFIIEVDSFKYKVIYDFEIQKNDKLEGLFEVIKESLKYTEVNIGKKMTLKTLISYDSYDKQGKILRPLNLLGKFEKEKQYETALIVSKEFSKDHRTSFLFSKRTLNIVIDVLKRDSLVYSILSQLEQFAKMNLFVIRNDYLGHINLNINMPFSFMVRNDNSLAKGTFAISLFESSTINKEVYHLLEMVTKQINIVLEALIPGLTLGIRKISEDMTSDGSVGVKVELLSLRGDSKIPLKYESEGIKKIISILSALIAMYNNEKVCLVIDELDAGVFEFLLGEILSVLKENSSGQLIFTSHNLRALEVLDKNDIMFTTTNSKRRYIRFKNIKNTNNLRDVYLREIFLGSQEEELYKRTKSYAINRAFRKAGTSNE